MADMDYETVRDGIAQARKQAFFSEAVDVVKGLRASWDTSPLGKGAMKTLDEVMKIERALIKLRHNRSAGEMRLAFIRSR
jgi:hypothetical protein